MIHKSSVIDAKAVIGKDVKIGPFSFVGPYVELKDGVELISNVHIEGNTKIGKNTKIFPFASIGTQPQDLKFKGEKTILKIGKNNIVTKLNDIKIENQRVNFSEKKLFKKKAYISKFFQKMKDKRKKIALFGTGHTACLFVNLFGLDKFINFAIEKLEKDRGIADE